MSLPHLRSTLVCLLKLGRGTAECCRRERGEQTAHGLPRDGCCGSRPELCPGLIGPVVDTNLTVAKEPAQAP